MDDEEVRLIKLNKVALYLNVTLDTINRWYRWWSSDQPKPPGIRLPELIREGNRGTRYIKVDDYEVIEHFKNNLPRGAMAEFNAAYLWGKRGSRALNNKGTTKEQFKSDIIFTVRP